MTDAEIIKALECCTTKGAKCSDCPAFKKVDRSDCKKYFSGALDLINRQQAEIERLESVLLGVMHFVDKWLDDVELEQDEINRASTMREKTLQIVEQQQSEIDRLKNDNEILSKNADTAFQDGLNETQDLYAEQVFEAVKEFAEHLKEKWSNNDYYSPDVDFDEFVDNLLKEIVGEE